jgi:hypothetical protein
MTSPIQQSPYLRDQRQFPNDDLKELANQSDHAYIDIAAKVNARTIGIYATGFQIVTGDKWFLQGQPQRQQTLRQVYTFPITAGTNVIAHGINVSTITTFTKIYGVATNNTTAWLPLPYANITSLTFQIEVDVSPTDIVVVQGASQTMTTAYIILEWLSQF